MNFSVGILLISMVVFTSCMPAARERQRQHHNHHHHGHGGGHGGGFEGGQGFNQPGYGNQGQSFSGSCKFSHKRIKENYIMLEK